MEPFTSSGTFYGSALCSSLSHSSLSITITCLAHSTKSSTSVGLVQACPSITTSVGLAQACPSITTSVGLVQAHPSITTSVGLVQSHPSITNNTLYLLILSTFDGWLSIRCMILSKGCLLSIMWYVY